MKAEVGVTQAEVTVCQQAGEAGGGKEGIPLELPWEPALLTTWMLADKAHFRLPMPRTVQEYTCVVLSHEACGYLLQPQ